MSKELLSLCFKVRDDLIGLYAGTGKKKNHHNLNLLANGTWRFFDEDFAGACGVASYMLTILAKRQNVPLGLIGHGYHIWCRMPNGVFVDPTYGQFDCRVPVYIGLGSKHHIPLGQRTKASAEEPAHNNLMYGEEVKSLLRRFPDEQNPFSRYHKKNIERWISSL